MKTSFAIIIIAAGASTRMKAVKQLLPLNNTTLLEHVIENAKQVNPYEIIVVLGANFKEISSRIEGRDIHILENKEWKMGMGTSIARGVIYAKSKKYNSVLVMLGDQPLIDEDYLNSLIELYNFNPEKIIATKYSKSNGVPVIFPNIYFEELQNLNTDVGAKALLNSQENIVTVEPGNKIMDIDTPRDYKNFIKTFNIK